MRRIQRFGMFLGACLLATTGCEPHHSFLRKQDEDELPARKNGVSRVDSDASKIIGLDSDDKKPTSFFKSDRTAGGWSSTAQEIERSLGTL